MADAVHEDPPIETDPERYFDDAVAAIQDVWPTWEPSDGDFASVVLQVLSNIMAEVADVAASHVLSIFKYLGRLHGINPIDATPAIATTNWTMVDNAGYEVPQGTQVAIAASGSERHAFVVAADFAVAPGQTQALGIELVAVAEGAQANALSAVPELLDPLGYVASVALVGVTANGVDDEDETEYLNRLVQRLQLQSPRPILPSDFAVLARDIAGVSRATAIDGYNPNGPLTDQERTITLAVVDDEGEALSAGIKQQVADHLAAMRETTFQVFVVDPTYTTLDVAGSGKAVEGWDPADVQARVNTAIAAHLDPGAHGRSLPELHDWENRTVIRYAELVQVVNEVPGFDYIEESGGLLQLTLAKAGDPPGRVNVAMAGVAPLPRPGAINFVVTAP